MKILKHSKILLVAFISAFVACTTALLGVAGTIIGSVLSSVLYNVLSEVLEEPFTKRASKQRFALKQKFEWEIAYVFPLVVIALIQLLLIAAFLSEWGLLPGAFLDVYLSLQGVADNNLYKLLGIALLVMSIYPLLLKADVLKKSHGWIIAFVGVIFLARGFVDAHNFITDLYAPIFTYFDFPIELIALVLIVGVIFKILNSANESRHDSKKVRNNEDYPRNQSRYYDLDDLELREVPKRRPPNRKKVRRPYRPRRDNRYMEERQNSRRNSSKINESYSDIEFESSDEYRR